VLTALFELHTRAENQILYDAGHEYLARRGMRLNAGRHVDGQPRNITSAQLAFACVNPYPDLDAKPLNSIYDGACASSA
jgi:hypothetical protein